MTIDPAMPDAPMVAHEARAGRSWRPPGPASDPAYVHSADDVLSARLDIAIGVEGRECAGTRDDLECAPARYDLLMSAGDAERLAIVVKALADPVRLRLVRLVADSPDITACSCHLPTVLGISQPTLSHHLKKLVDSGILLREQRGRWVHYRLNAPGLGLLVTFVTGCATVPGPA